MSKTISTLITVVSLMMSLVRSVTGQLAGFCYNVDGVGPWIPIDSTAAAPEYRGPPPDESGDSINLTVPSRIRLSDIVSRGGFTVDVPEVALQTPHRFRFWSLAGDSLNLVFSTGFSGTHGNFGAVATGWAGRLRTLSDQGGSLLYERAFLLTQVDCGSPPPQLASLDRGLPRAVQLSSGQLLELGRVLPEGIPVIPRRSGAVAVVSETRGLFVGADTLIALVNGDGLVARVEVHFTAGFDLEGLVEAIRAEFGVSLSLGDRGESWANRTTRVYAFRSAAPGQFVRIVMQDPRLGG